jgi:hypothetical protein
MNTSAQPADGAGGSRSKAAGELTLDLMSGEYQWVYADPLWELPAREGGLTADLFLPNVLGQIVGAGLPAMAACQPTNPSRMYPTQLWERACSRWPPNSQQCFSPKPTIQTIPTRLSGCPSEARSLAFARRCQFSDRDCKPANSLLGAHWRTYNRGAFLATTDLWWLCAGDLRVCRGCLTTRSCRPAHSCHPSSASDAGCSNFR